MRVSVPYLCNLTPVLFRWVSTSYHHVVCTCCETHAIMLPCNPYTRPNHFTVTSCQMCVKVCECACAAVTVTSQFSDAVIALQKSVNPFWIKWLLSRQRSTVSLLAELCCPLFAHFIKGHYWWINLCCPFLVSLCIFQMEPDYILASNRKSSKNTAVFKVHSYATVCFKGYKTCLCVHPLHQSAWSSLEITLPSWSKAA